MPKNKDKSSIEMVQSLLSKLIEEENHKTLFGVNIKIGQIIPNAFDPEKTLFIRADSTPEFIVKLKEKLMELKEPAPSKKELRKLENHLSNMEMEFVAKLRYEQREKKYYDNKFN